MLQFVIFIVVVLLYCFATVFTLIFSNEPLYKKLSQFIKVIAVSEAALMSIVVPWNYFKKKSKIMTTNTLIEY